MLPACKHRATVGDRFLCLSPKIIHFGDGTVTAEQCGGCALADRGDTLGQPRFAFEVEQSRPAMLDDREPCKHKGETVLGNILCRPCGGSVRIKTYACNVFGECSISKDVGVACCATCPKWEPNLPVTDLCSPLPQAAPTQGRTRMLSWCYGVTTVPRRRDDLLPRTLESLKAAGFDAPRLFVDGARNREAVWWEDKFKLDVTARFPNVRTAGNWVLSLYELYYRSPLADRYALFQDDLVTYHNLRAYLDHCTYPDKGYLNLYTFPPNRQLPPPRVGQTARFLEGWYPSNQFGRGAVALVFSRAAVVTLLSAEHLTERPQDPKRGHRSIDGGIVDSFRKAGWREYVHNPSLVQHTGEQSSMGNRPHQQAVSFRGEGYNALDLLREGE